jgi:HEPN domain-containing protein
MNEKVQYWLGLADYDLETARVMLEGRRFLYVGFMCHQVIEKILKGYYVFAKNDNPPYTHNLSYLAEQSGIYGKMTEEFKGIMDIIEPLNVEARYPTHKEKLMQTLSYEKCKEIIRKTEELYQWIKKQLSDA